MCYIPHPSHPHFFFALIKAVVTSNLDLNLRKKLVKCCVWNIVLYSVGTLRKVDQKYVLSFEMRCWRRIEKVGWTDRVRKEEVLHKVKEERNILHTIKIRKANWIGHILCRICLIQRVIVEEAIDVFCAFFFYALCQFTLHPNLCSVIYGGTSCDLCCYADSTPYFRWEYHSWFAPAFFQKRNWGVKQGLGLLNDSSPSDSYMKYRRDTSPSPLNPKVIRTLRFIYFWLLPVKATGFCTCHDTDSSYTFVSRDGEVLHGIWGLRRLVVDSFLPGYDAVSLV